MYPETRSCLSAFSYREQKEKATSVCYRDGTDVLRVVLSAAETADQLFESFFKQKMPNIRWFQPLACDDLLLFVISRGSELLIRKNKLHSKERFIVF